MPAKESDVLTSDQVRDAILGLERIYHALHTAERMANRNSTPGRIEVVKQHDLSGWDAVQLANAESIGVPLSTIASKARDAVACVLAAMEQSAGVN